MPAVAARTMNADAIVSDSDGDVHLLKRSIAGIPGDIKVDDSDSEPEQQTTLPLGPEPDLKMTQLDESIEYDVPGIGSHDVPIATIPDRFKVNGPTVVDNFVS